MMLQELFDRWNEIQKQYGADQTVSIQDQVAEELNILEAMRLLNCSTIPGEPSDIGTLITRRHKQLEMLARKYRES